MPTGGVEDKSYARVSRIVVAVIRRKEASAGRNRFSVIHPVATGGSPASRSPEGHGRARVDGEAAEVVDRDGSIGAVPQTHQELTRLRRDDLAEKRSRRDSQLEGHRTGRVSDGPQRCVLRTAPASAGC